MYKYTTYRWKRWSSHKNQTDKITCNNQLAWSLGNFTVNDNPREKSVGLQCTRTIHNVSLGSYSETLLMTAWIAKYQPDCMSLPPNPTLLQVCHFTSKEFMKIMNLPSHIFVLFYWRFLHHIEYLQWWHVLLNDPWFLEHWCTICNTIKHYNFIIIQ